MRVTKNIITGLIGVVLIQAGLLSAAQAASVNMTCKQAIDYYHKYKLIYVYVGKKKDRVPIYGMKSAKEKFNCKPKKFKSPYPVHTTDSKRCVIGYRCTK